MQLRDNFGAALAGGDYSTLQIIGAGVSDLTLVATSNSTLTVTYYVRFERRVVALPLDRAPCNG